MKNPFNPLTDFTQIECGGGGGGGGGATQKKTEKKNSPKFEICGSLRFFSVFSGFFSFFFRSFSFFSVFLGYFFSIKRRLSLMIGLLLISRMINQFKFISSSRLSKWTKKTGITG